MTIGATLAVERMTVSEPAGLRMIAIILALLYGTKAVVTVESDVRLSARQWLAFCWFWFGMRPGIFTNMGGKTLAGSRELMIKGLMHLLIGFAAVMAARAIWVMRELLGDVAARWIATVPLLVGLSLILHFGVFDLLAAFWRTRGVDCRPLFRAPILAKSLNEFWSRRWNLAFSEMTAVAVYRPLTSIAGRRVGLVGSFVVSGLLHETAISVPVLAGFGGPSLYFILHGIFVLVENGLSRAGMSIDSHPWLGRFWTFVALALPSPLLFHRPFLAGVVWPIVGITDS